MLRDFIEYLTSLYRKLYMMQATTKSFTSLVISGGAIKVVSAVGCLTYMQEHGMLNTIQTYVGTSAGSVVCFFLVIGYTPQEIYDFMRHHLQRSEVADMINVDDILSMNATLGMSNGRSLIKLFQQILFDKTNMLDITFIDLAKRFGKNLVVTVSNLTLQQEEYISVDTYPDMSVIEALKMSCSIPILFTPVQYNGCMYVDGGVYANFPLTYFLKKGHVFADIIGINLISKDDIHAFDNMTCYMSYLLSSTMNHINRLQLEALDINSKKNKNIVTISIEDVSWISLTEMKMILPEDKGRELLDIGYQHMQQIFQE